MTEYLEIDCNGCNATFKLQHNLNVSRYEMGFCPFCSSEDIDSEDVYDEDDENEEDY